MALLVVALDVDALEITKFDELPKRVAMLAETAVREFRKAVAKARMFPVMLVKVVEASVEEPEIERLVPERLFVFKLVIEALVEKIFVEVELVMVA